MPAKKSKAAASKTKKAATKKTTAKKASTKKAAAAKAPAKKTAAKKAPAKKAGTAKKAAAKKSTAKKAPVKKNAAQKTAAKKTAAKKAPVKKATPKKAASSAKKASVKKVASKSASSTKKATVKKTVVKKPAATKKTGTVAKKEATKKSSSKPKEKKTAVSVASRNEAAPVFKPYVVKRSEDYMNDPQKDHFREILNDWKSELMAEVDRTVMHMKDEASNFPDPADRASQEEEFSLELRTRDRERKLIRKIDSTLELIEMDEYGYCEACGVEIGIQRLEARPTASLCIDCKTLDEIKERQEHG